MTVAIRKARQRARKAENGEKEIRFYASPKAQEWAAQAFPSMSIHEAARVVFETVRVLWPKPTTLVWREECITLEELAERFPDPNDPTIKEDGK